LWASLIALLGVAWWRPDGWAGAALGRFARRAGGDPVFGGALCGQSGGAAPSGPARRPGEIAFFQSLFIALFMAPAAPWLGMVPGSGPVVGTIAAPLFWPRFRWFAQLGLGAGAGASAASGRI
jgi:hypothetical protein